MYQVAYRSPLDGQVYRLRRKYSDLISAQSAADDYNIGEPCIPHWAEPIKEEPSHVSNVEITISQESLII
jgi:hypothetical protein